MEMNRYLKLLIVFLIGLAIFTVARIALYFIYYDQFASYKIGVIIATMISGVRFDASILLTVTAPFFLLLMLPIKNRIFHKIVLWALYPIYIFIALFSITDVIYYGYIERHITNEPFLMGNDMSFMIDMLPTYWIHLLIAVIVFIMVGFFWKKLVDIKLKADLKCIFANISILLLLVGVSFVIIRGNIALKPIALIDAYSNSDTKLGNLKLNGVFSTTRYLDDETLPLDAYQFFDNETANNIVAKSYNKTCDMSAVEGIDFKNKNIVIIMLESFSSHYVDSFGGHDFGVTPNIDNISSRSIKFMKHYSVNKRSVTSIQAALTGIPNIRGLPYLGFGLESYSIGNLGKLFTDNGYDTIFVQSSHRRSYYMDSISLSLGFENYYGMEDVKTILDYPNKNTPSFGWDYETFMLLSDKIKVLYSKNKKPFLAFIFTGTTHEPFPAELPQQFMRFDHSASEENAFKNTVIYADWSVGQFIDSFKAEPYYDDTIFVITADHSNGLYKDTEYPNDFWIPMIIHSNKMTKSVEISNITSHVDLSKTLTNLVGLDNDTRHESFFCKDNDSTALLYHGSVVGLVTDDGYLNHSLENILDSSLPRDNSTERRNELSDYIKAYHQVMFNKVVGSKK